MNESLPYYNVVPFRHKNKPLGINHQMAVAKNSISFLPGPSKRKTPSFGDISIATDIYIITGYTDMRKSIDGLCAIIASQLKEEPRGHTLYMFCGKRCDRIKVLLREPDGFVLLYKRLDVVQGRYRWPRNKSEVKPITWQQFDWLMSGLEIEQPKALITA